MRPVFQINYHMEAHLETPANGDNKELRSAQQDW